MTIETFKRAGLQFRIPICKEIFFLPREIKKKDVSLVCLSTVGAFNQPQAVGKTLAKVLM